MDIATIIGICLGFGMVIITIAAGAGPMMFIHIPSLAITAGGMIAATLIHFSLGQVLKINSIVKKTLFCKLPTEQELMQKMVNYSAINRRDGALALEKQIPDASDDFLVKGLQMLIDGQNDQIIEDQLFTEIQYLQERHANGKKILEFMGASAPAFGMIGTLIGLVQMMGTLDSPDKIGEGMAVALITTFYGAVMANLVFIPLAGKLGIRSKRETLLCEMTVQGIVSIAKGMSPTEVRERMQAFVSARYRHDVKPNV